MSNEGPLQSPAPAQPDDMGPAHAGALDALIDGGCSPLEFLPPLWHWTYFLEWPRQVDLGPDGHPRVGRPTPPAPGLRRMFAGGRVTTHRLLALGEPAVARSVASPPVKKDGRTGPLWFVTVRHDYEQAGEVRVTEERDIVYRPAMPAGQVGLVGSQSVEGEEPVAGDGIDLDIDETLLFRFSALTYNAHRIHYDLDWAAREGYGGLVVHGPLQALMLGEFFRRRGDDLVGRTFDYRMVAPFVGAQRLRVRAVGDETAAVYNAEGTRTAVATLT